MQDADDDEEKDPTKEAPAKSEIDCTTQSNKLNERIQYQQVRRPPNVWQSRASASSRTQRCRDFVARFGEQLLRSMALVWRELALPDIQRVPAHARYVCSACPDEIGPWFQWASYLRLSTSKASVTLDLAPRFVSQRKGKPADARAVHHDGWLSRSGESKFEYIVKGPLR